MLLAASHSSGDGAVFLPDLSRAGPHADRRLMDRGLCFVPALLSSGLSPDSFSYRYGGSPVRPFFRSSLVSSLARSIPGAALFSVASRLKSGASKVGLTRDESGIDIHLSDCCHPQRHRVSFSPIRARMTHAANVSLLRGGESSARRSRMPYRDAGRRDAFEGGRKCTGVRRAAKNVTRLDGAATGARAQVERERRV